MKKFTLILFVLVLVMFTGLSVKADSMELKSVETILSEIRMDQNIASTDPIDVSKVTAARLEELGDSVMEKVIGNTSVHDRMDIALGGDGSVSLTNVHIRVGYDYLMGYPITMMTFMGSTGMMGFGGMMGGSGFYTQNYHPILSGGMMGSGSLDSLAFGLLGLVAVIIIVAYLLTRKSRNSIQPMGNNSINIASERYSKGEISREEYLKLLEDLKK